MGAQDSLFSKYRPSDLRYDNVHILAEYIARAQRFADSATQIETSAEQLVKGAMQTTEQGVRQFQAILRQLQSEFKTLQSQLSHVVDTAGRDIAGAITEGHASGAHYITMAGEVAMQRCEGLAKNADDVNQAAQRLEQAADKAEARLQLAREELEQLLAFKAELVQFEHESRARIADAKAALYQGVGLWQRLCYVLFPPTPVVRKAMIPRRPSVLSREVRTQAAMEEGRDRKVGRAGDAASTGNGRGR